MKTETLEKAEIIVNDVPAPKAEAAAGGHVQAPRAPHRPLAPKEDPRVKRSQMKSTSVIGKNKLVRVDAHGFVALAKGGLSPIAGVSETDCIDGGEPSIISSGPAKVRLGVAIKGGTLVTANSEGCAVPAQQGDWAAGSLAADGAFDDVVGIVVSPQRA